MAGGTHIVIAGSGALGSVAALELAKAGRRVTLVDPGPAGRNASGVAAGMLAPAFESLFDPGGAEVYPLFLRARDLWPALAAEAGFELSREGAVGLAGPDEAEAWMERLAAAGATARLLPASEAARFGRAAGADARAVFSPDDWRLDPQSALHAIRRAAEACGVELLAGRVAARSGGRIYLSDGLAMEAGELVIATGAGLGLASLAPELARLEPIKGHIGRLASDAAAGPTLRIEGAYLCRTGRELILGATMEPGRRDETVDPAAAATLFERAARTWPDLPPARAWRLEAGVRAATADGLPMVGRSRSGAWLAVGARRNGWLLAPLIAASLVAMAEGAPPEPLFDPARFDGAGGAPA